MNEEVQKKAIEMLEALAAKLGTTAEHLWQMFVVQAQVEAVNTVVQVVAAVVLVWVTHRYIWRWMWRKPENDGRAFVVGVFSVLSFVSSLYALIGVFTISTKLLNPEYWAFRKILSLF